MKNDIDELKKALILLNIPEKASLIEIKKIYKDLLYQWHPDRCIENKKLCNEKTQQIIRAYKILLTYCDNYRFSFNKENLEKNFGKPNAVKFWYDRFGDDPIWG